MVLRAPTPEVIDGNAKCGPFKQPERWTTQRLR